MAAAETFDAWTVHTEVFDGPLDLLLHLVRRDGIDLRQVTISRIADAYLAYLDRMRELHLGVAAEYLVMAATLCHLKSLELLPRPPTSTVAEAEPEDPREALVRRLADYQRYREAAEALDERPHLDRDAFAREPADLGDQPRPLVAGMDAFGLLDLYHQILVKASAPEPEHVIGRSGPDFPTCCERVLERLAASGGRIDLAAMLLELVTRVERVLTFLGVLEMTRLRWLDLDQREHLGPVTVVRRDTPVDLAVLGGKVEIVA